MTASKPETVSGAIGFSGSHEIWFSPVAAPRTRRVTSYPRALSEGKSAVPMGPETPLTRIREIMADKIPLYQFAEHRNKRRTPLKALKSVKCRKAAGEICGQCPLHAVFARYNPSWRACANRLLPQPSR